MRNLLFTIFLFIGSYYMYCKYINRVNNSTSLFIFKIFKKGIFFMLINILSNFYIQYYYYLDNPKNLNTSPILLFVTFPILLFFNIFYHVYSEIKTNEKI